MSQVEVQQKRWAGGDFSRKNKRKSHRKDVTGFMADIADTTSVVGGEIENISSGGFKMINVPSSFTGSKHTYTTVLNGNGKYYRLVAKPCWMKKSAEKGSVEIGFKIIDAPWEWVDLTLNGTN